jgi:hypothetical protein
VVDGFVQPSSSASRHRGEKKESIMIKKKVLVPSRIRRIERGFSFIPHRFLTDGFLVVLDQKEILLYLFLVLVSDRNGLSFYSYDAICTLLQLTVDEYIEARDALIKKELIAFDGTLFQVLDLPQAPVSTTKSNTTHSEIAELIRQSLGEGRSGR